jgi:NAD(P)-dependent dehydrogenase (short-subunit alcohol dehydrogenase family)
VQITDNVFVVSGAGSDIGREVVLALLARGGRVAAVDLSREGLDGTTELTPSGARERLSTHVVEVTDRSAVETIPEAVREAHGRVDGLVNVAGSPAPFVKFADLDHREMEKVLAADLWGVIHTCATFLAHLLARREACIVNVSSMAALGPVPGQAVQGAGRAAVRAFTESLYCELRATTVDVTVVLAGDADTTSAAEVAREVVQGIEKGSFRVVVGKDARALDRRSRFSPQRATDEVAKRMAPLLER